MHKSLRLLVIAVVFTVSALPTVALAPDSGWDGRSWLNGLDAEVQAIATIGTELYVGGQFTQINGQPMSP